MKIVSALELPKNANKTCFYSNFYATLYFSTLQAKIQLDRSIDKHTDIWK